MSCSILWKLILVIFKLVRPVGSFCGKTPLKYCLKKPYTAALMCSSLTHMSFLFIAFKRLYRYIKRSLFHQKSIEILHLCFYFNFKKP